MIRLRAVRSLRHRLAAFNASRGEPVNCALHNSFIFQYLGPNPTFHHSTHRLPASVLLAARRSKGLVFPVTIYLSHDQNRGVPYALPPLQLLSLKVRDSPRPTYLAPTNVLNRQPFAIGHDNTDYCKTQRGLRRQLGSPTRPFASSDNRSRCAPNPRPRVWRARKTLSPSWASREPTAQPLSAC